MRTACLSLVLALCVLAAPRFARADWPTCGRAISTAPNGQTHPAIAEVTVSHTRLLVADYTPGPIVATRRLRSTDCRCYDHGS